MLTLLAESKTMSSNLHEISDELYLNHQPPFEETADSIMLYFQKLQPSEIATKLGISQSLGLKAHELAYDFPHKITGYPALEAFTGEAFRSLSASTLSEEAKKRALTDLKFISSVYGLLNVSDIIKPYRCEFNKPVNEKNQTPIQIYKPKITSALVKYIKENNIKEIINLLPGDADKCVDWKIVRAFAKVHKVVFQIITPDDKLKTPIAKRLKELRGLMARQILEKGISSFHDLTTIENNEFVFSPEYSKTLLPVFITDK